MAHRHSNIDKRSLGKSSLDFAKVYWDVFINMYSLWTKNTFLLFGVYWTNILGSKEAQEILLGLMENCRSPLEYNINFRFLPYLHVVLEEILVLFVTF